ncbi:MAG TPA: SdrD B-like domain-containing protein [Longimicrobiales bacterium]|nr:SdrD B-like domain-containing protein [Longimicrobiales bacterium]
MRIACIRVPACLFLVAALWACQEPPTAPAGLIVDRPLYQVIGDAEPLSGAIFTTTEDGSIVNENVRYEKKEDVYLDGGPGPNAPARAAGLPEGDYFFQVTDPSGKDLLSTDHISCRKIHVNANGVIDEVYAGENYEWQNGRDAGWVSVACQHAQGVDIDHPELGAITVQLFPYDDTPNPGGVYKAWVTPVEQYTGDIESVPEARNDPVNGESYAPGNYHGFIPRWSKTDNYKVKQRGPPFVPPELTIRKFHDRNLNGVQDAEEPDVTGWQVALTDPLGITNTETTPALVLTAEPGDYTAVEATPAGTLETVSYLDGVVMSLLPSADPSVVVSVAGTSGETHEIVYGNVGLGEITACKVFDRNGNGAADAGEPGVPGWKIRVSGTIVDGSSYGPVTGFTEASDGCVTFGGLLPGTYTVEELFPSGDEWSPTGDTSETVTIESSLSGSVIAGTVATFTFTNCCEKTADFGTKGYWHNKNGLSELSEADQVYVNGLAPYATPSSYFGAGDEPFDGLFSDGTQVAAAFRDDGSEIWDAGTWQAEVSHFLVDSNAGGDPREQLAQQLLAFIFNVRHRLEGPEAAIGDGDGWVVAGDLIDEAIAIWESGTDAERNAMQQKLNSYNESDAVVFIPYGPCDVIYP